jgi:hypothetical protein
MMSGDLQESWRSTEPTSLPGIPERHTSGFDVLVNEIRKGRSKRVLLIRPDPDQVPFENRIMLTKVPGESTTRVPVWTLREKRFSMSKKNVS